MLIRAYRVRGHLLASLDPLGLKKQGYYSELDPRTYGFTDKNENHPIFINGELGYQEATLSQILAKLRETYCGSLTTEFMHSQEAEQRDWIQKRFESPQPPLSLEKKKQLLELLTRAEGFERFLHVKFPGAKRFGLEGGESLIPGLEEALSHATRHGLKEAVLGMSHRGRLNVLNTIMGKPFEAIINEFQGKTLLPTDIGSGDVKYHLGTSSNREIEGQKVHISLTSNPSHLEAADSVVVGKVRAKQAQRKDENCSQVLGILIHGDAAFAGQGVVAETFMLSDLKGYRTGGTLHIVVNNQIGFTTSPEYSRSSPYCSSVGKIVQAPIIHVNGDSPEDVLRAFQIAVEFRYRFKKDVVIDMMCYRRHGHNESDEPSFTQPLMYKAINQHPTTRTLYARQLVQEGVLTQEEAEAMVKTVEGGLQKAFDQASSYESPKAAWLEGVWAGFERPPQDWPEKESQTGVSLEVLQKVGAALTQIPAGKTINSKILRQLAAKEQMMKTGQNIDWGTGEALAFGSLLLEGTGVRLSGQDSGRGTFSHRHGVLIDQETEERYVPLSTLSPLSPTQAPIEIVDSPLAEFSVLGFECGYSLAEPRTLVIWEAQFGDFANGAQVIIDQFISSGETKWLRMSGLVMLLPHGYEGQGPEHSSARLERYLQLSAENNWQVLNCTTPASYFHALRRQICRSFRKPLVVMTPKSLLRHKQAVSSLEELATGTSFLPVIPHKTTSVPDGSIQRVVLCSGKVYYDLLQQRQELKKEEVALVRLEQLYPFPAKELAQELKRYPQAQVIWCQEEPMNMGSWTFIDRRVEAVLKSISHGCLRPIYEGRPEAASPATGYHDKHDQEQKALVWGALGAS
jgi:2-oxoglutarate dehydrogenase E1 component